jgi:hypothetical protein
LQREIQWLNREQKEGRVSDLFTAAFGLREKFGLVDEEIIEILAQWVEEKPGEEKS